MPDNDVENYSYSWQTTYNKPIPSETSAAKQRSWDNPIVERDFMDLLLNYTNDYDKARLLAASAKHSADWINASPITSCGLRLNDEAVRVAVSLRLGADICQPHTCFCGAAVDVKRSHAQSCKRNNGRIIQHNNLNDIILRSLTRENIPATKKPNGLLRTDGKRPDGLTLSPWREGRCLVWDVTIVNTIAASYLIATSSEAGSVAEFAASHEEVKYQDLTERYVFVPIAIESLGPLGSKATSFLSELGRRITAATSDVKETNYLYQRISVALQKFNAICI